jgi:hypothetical protein
MKKPDITINFYKHHLQFVKQILASEKERNIEPILQQIRSIGNNVLDLYTGELSPEEIKEEIIIKLHPFKVTTQAEFALWLGNSEYKTIILKDESIWVLRKGIQGEEFIHAHPARTGKNVMRTTGSAWKTAFALALLQPLIPVHYKTKVEQVNYIRINFLEMSPVKRIVGNSSLEIAINLLR